MLQFFKEVHNFNEFRSLALYVRLTDTKMLQVAEHRSTKSFEERLEFGRTNEVLGELVDD